MSRSVCSDPLSPLFLVHLPSHLPRTPATYPSWAGIPVALDASEDAVDGGAPSAASTLAGAAVPGGTAVPTDKAQSAAAQRPYMDRLAEEMYQFEHGPNLKSLPSGYLGSLVVTKSGKLRMKLGAVSFDVRDHGCLGVVCGCVCRCVCVTGVGCMR
jgi:hypothetical protein